jgi:hypothetical protein
MPANKNAQLSYSVIDRMLSVQPNNYPSLSDIKRVNTSVGPYFNTGLFLEHSIGITEQHEINHHTKRKKRSAQEHHHRHAGIQ